jgi:hypothetical protein
MEKAYDLKSLGEMIVDSSKKNGMATAEVALEKLAAVTYEAVMAWVQESARLSETKIDDLVVPFLAHFDSMVKSQIEKIDLDGDGK